MVFRQHSRALVPVSLALACLLAMTASAEEKIDGWIPPVSDEWDWVHTNSGEWVKGEVTALRDRKVEFDSDEFDDVSIDLSDVKELYLYRRGFLRTESGDTAQGTGVLRGDVLTFETVEGETLEIRRADIISIVPGGESELDYWAFEAGASYAMKDGNTNQVDLSGSLGIHRNTATTRFRNTYRGVYGSQDDEKDENNHRASSRLDIFLTSRFFVTAPMIEYYKDEFKNLKHRVTPGAGIGYEFVRNSFMELDVAPGVAYQFTESENGDTADDFAGTLRINLDFDLPGGTELDNAYALQAVVTDFDKTSHHFESILSVDVWGPLDLDLTFMLDRIEEPQADAGDQPDSNDITVMAGFSIDF